MKRKLDLLDVDQNERRQKKQKCQELQLELKREGEFERRSSNHDAIMIYVENSQALNNNSSDENDQGTNRVSETNQDCQTLEIFGEGEGQSVGSYGPASPPALSSATSSTPDYLTPTLLLLIFNITLPTFDLYKDLTMLMRLSFYPQYWAWEIFLFAGVFLNFLFTCWAWWRLEPRQNKSWTWILLLLQVKLERNWGFLQAWLLLLAGVAPDQGSHVAGADLEGGPQGQAGEGHDGQGGGRVGALLGGHAHCLGDCRHELLQGRVSKQYMITLLSNGRFIDANYTFNWFSVIRFVLFWF